MTTPALRLPRDGLAVGLIASATVAVFYALFDFLAARGVLHTVNLLGRSIIRGDRDPAILLLPIQADPGAIVLYSGLHLVLSLAIGVIVVRLLAQAERQPTQAALMVLAVVAGFVITILTVGYFTTPMRPLLPWWSTVVANSLAVVVAGWFLIRRHPGLWRRLFPVRG